MAPCQASTWITLTSDSLRAALVGILDQLTDQRRPVGDPDLVFSSAVSTTSSQRPMGTARPRQQLESRIASADIVHGIATVLNGSGLFTTLPATRSRLSAERTPSLPCLRTGRTLS